MSDLRDHLDINMAHNGRWINGMCFFVLAFTGLGQGVLLPVAALCAAWLADFIQAVWRPSIHKNLLLVFLCIALTILSILAAVLRVI